MALHMSEVQTSSNKRVTKKHKGQHKRGQYLAEEGISIMTDPFNAFSNMPQNQAINDDEPSDFIKAIMIAALQTGDMNRPDFFRTTSDDEELTPEPIPISESELRPRKHKSRKHSNLKSSKHSEKVIVS